MSIAIPLHECETADRAAKCLSTFDSDCAQLEAYYEDVSRGFTVAMLRQLGMGIATQSRPHEISLIRWVVDQLAVAYTSPPSRWIEREGKRLSENGSEHKRMLAILAESSYDEAWREIDRRRALWGQVFVRLYPVDAVRRVEMRVFGPHQVRRIPDPGAGSVVDADSRIALQLGPEMWEVWEPDPTGCRCWWTNTGGTVLRTSPYGESGQTGLSKIPLQVIYDRYPAGRPYVYPRGHRLAAIERINALSNELLTMIRSQGHSQRVFKGVRPIDLPADRGPGVDLALQDPESDAMDLTPSPKITESLEVLKHDIRMFLVSENLPPDALLESTQVLTGAALKQSMRGLLERRKTLAALAPASEREMYERFREIHNQYAVVWNRDMLPEGQMVVELAPLEVPVDAREEAEVIARELGLGISSMVDAVMRTRNVPRHRAVEILEQIEADFERFQPRTDPQDLQSGPKTSLAPDALLDTPGATRASVVDAVQKSPQGGQENV